MHAPHASSTDDLKKIASAAFTAGNYDVAKAYLVSARDDDPSDTSIDVSMAEVAIARREYRVAAALLERAVALDPNNVMARARFGNALWRCQQYGAARDTLEDALAMSPVAPVNWLIEQNLGLVEYFSNHAMDAVGHLDRALALMPGHPWVKSDHAHAVLKSGDLRRGLELYEARWGVILKSPAWDCGLPLWDGRENCGTILVHAEQGFGDTLQFIRFVPEIKRRFGVDVIFAGPRGLKRLIAGQCGIASYADYERVGELLTIARGADYHCPLISAVSRLGLTYSTLPAATPYLVVPTLPAAPNPIFSTKGLDIGLVWAASTNHERSRQRSVSVLDLLPLAGVAGARLWSLQMAPHASEAVETGADLVVRDATPGVGDFADTAAIISNMDAVVTVDTAMVHLAGALGVRCFMLNPVNSCWRWCHGAAPWYSTVELFDQSSDLSWGGAIRGVRDRLSDLSEDQQWGHGL